jgi:hypothetical protein
MSGGHFDYNCFKISQFADELGHEIEINEDKGFDRYGDKVGANYPEEVINRLKSIHSLILLSGELAKEVEWLYSGDSSDDSFCKMVDEIRMKHNKSINEEKV